ncbi:MAG: hypothetical protein ACR2GY_06610 [Phycisphaerales bacterium]
MAQVTKLVFACASAPAHPVHLARELVSICGTDRVWTVWHSTSRVEPDEVRGRLRRIANNERQVASNLPLSELGTHINRNGWTALHLLHTSVGEAIYAEVSDLISEDVRGACAPSEPIVTIGPHDCVEHLMLIGDSLPKQVQMSFTLFGNQTPQRPQLFYEEVFALPTVVLLRSQIEAIVGPVKTALAMDV